MKQPTKQFAFCVDNVDYEVDLILGKVYPIIPDATAGKDDFVRIVDESGEDYGYSAERFFMLEVPDALAKALRSRSKATVRRPDRTLQPVIGSRRRMRG